MEVLLRSLDEVDDLVLAAACRLRFRVRIPASLAILAALYCVIPS